MNTKAAEQKLLSLYDKWFNEVNKSAPDFFTGKDYSCPYYMGIPHGWFESEARVLVVAENGFGYYGNGKEEGISPSNYSVLQKINLGELPKAVNNIDEGEHPFWTRTRRICNYGFPVAWTAIDKICFRRDRKSKLADADRERLHAVEKRVLAEEIEILNPTIVLFFGWHETSLAHELPEVYAELYPSGKGDDSAIKHKAKMEIKKTLLITAFVFVVIILISFVCYPIFGIIMMISYGIFMLILIAMSGSMYRRKIKEIKLKQEQVSSAQSGQSIPVQKRSGGKQTAIGALDNPVVKAAASYAIGKAVLEASKKTESYQKNHRNPNADRYDGLIDSQEYDFDKTIYDLNSRIELLSSQADHLDYVVAIASGIACGILDILWVGEFNLAQGRGVASDKVDYFVKKTAEMLEGKKFDDVKSAVKALEKRFPLASDGNTPDFGGRRQHHLRDFAHHPTIVGLAFSLLTQFTEKSYGTDVNGVFLVVDVLEKSKPFIGKDIPQKILMGTITWFFHLVSDVAGSGSTAGVTEGTGIPGPILALAKEVSAIPLFKDMKVHGDMSLSLFLSKLFNGTLMMRRDENGQIIKESAIKFDLRGELGVSVELCKQAVPVVANECIVRAFYFIRHLAMAMKENRASCLADMKKIDWNSVKPANNPTMTRMLTISTGVFTALDIGEAIVTQKYWVSINYVGVGRFAVAIGSDVSWSLKARNVKKVRDVYENIRHQTFRKADADIYKRIGEDMDLQMDKPGLSLEQTEILYNLEYYKTLHDIEHTNIPITGDAIKELKNAWIREWAKFISNGFESFTQISGAEMHWYSMDELHQFIAGQNPNEPWYRLILLEAMLFEPYYPLGLEKDKKGNDVPCKKYTYLNNPINGFKKGEGDRFLNEQFTGRYCEFGYVKRLRKSYDKRMNELNEVLKTVITSLSITAVIAIVTIATAGAFAGPIAVALVGSNFAGLSGAALTSACLAYLGGGAIAAGGAGMLGGTIAIVGGGAALGIGVGAGVGGAVGSAGLLGKKNVIMQSAKLLTSVREIFLNDEYDVAFSNSVYEQYLQNITEIEKGLVELRLKKDVAQGKEKKAIEETIKKAEESVEAMKIARKSMLKYNSSFAKGLQGGLK